MSFQKILGVALTCSSSVFLYGFQNGGPAGLVYGYLFCWVGILCVVASLGEMASMYVLFTRLTASIV
jgi:amino acid permease